MNFSHFNENGKVKMVDVGNKETQERVAKAHGKIFLAPTTIKAIESHKIKKGNVLTTAEIAGIQAAKKTYELIPLCHQLMLTDINVQAVVMEDGILATSVIKCDGKTGVEMEALTAVQVALLTVYDMCKAIDKNMVMGEIKLLSKIKKDLD